jgi:preprotein translocase subunit SecY
VIQALQNIWNVPDLRKRVLFMLGLLAVYRVGSFVPIPYVDPVALQQFFSTYGGGVLGFLDLFSGGSLSRLSVFALGIMPYITASIILQLLTVVWPYLEKLSKEGELGRRKITTYTRYLTVVLAAIQSATMAVAFQRQAGVVTHPGVGFILMTVITLTSGTAFIMWLGEQITERGIGNGMSLIIFAGIVVRLPAAIYEIYQKVATGDWSLIIVVLITAIVLAIVAFVVLVERGQRRIPVQYAKRVVGRRVLGGQATHLPLRVNTSGVIPVIFASSVLTFPQTFGMFSENRALRWITDNLASGEPLFNLLYIGGIIFFCYFYTSIIFNPNEIADNMRKYGGFVPGIRPGKRTAEHINGILTRITLVGALYLAIIAIIPEFMNSGFHVQSLPVIGSSMDAVLPAWFTTGLGLRELGGIFGGTSLLILVGVAMDTVQMVESQLIMRHYDGFLKKGRIRGRRG